MPSNWTHLIRFVAQEDGQIHLGQVDPKTYPDLGIASVERRKIEAHLITGSLFDGLVTEKKMTVAQLLSPISVDETPIIRCLGLNYRDHAREAKMPIPSHPVLFVKPRAALCGPYPQKISVPKVCQDGTSDYEAELTVIIGKTGRDIPKEKALEYVLGYTCGNDVSARTEQFRNSQWSFSKGEIQLSCPRTYQSTDRRPLRLRLFRPHRPRPCRTRANRRPAQPPHQSHPQRKRRPGLQHQGDDLRNIGNDRFLIARNYLGAGIPDHDGDTAWDWGDERPEGGFESW